MAFRIITVPFDNKTGLLLDNHLSKLRRIRPGKRNRLRRIRHSEKILDKLTSKIEEKSSDVKQK